MHAPSRCCQLSPSNPSLGVSLRSRTPDPCHSCTDDRPPLPLPPPTPQLPEQRPGRCLSSLPGLSLPEKAAGLPVLWFWPHSEAGPDSTWAANKCQSWRRLAYMSSGQLQVCTDDPFSSTLVRAARCRRCLPSTRSPSWCS